MFWSYLDPCGADDYQAMEPFLDAELRAVGAHLLIPVGEHATQHVLQAYSADDRAPGQVYGEPVHGNGFLIHPLSDPEDWT
ncbi:MAG: uracil-DNA glycosylase, partial [Candidatus Nanohaloarchaea archaeon]|nr:uracil-DNA glycosylase [Candidatus Nanohaloarchaea archaeon]